jgi:DNA mismatch endonuclease (patch repair protein)
MTDRLSRERRSWNMSRIRSRDTQPERIVRSALHRAGYRFRLHRRDLPGRPDIVLPRYHTAIFVHGCFWHRHKQCRLAYTPKSRVTFWTEKFRRNVERDRENTAALRKLGWRVITVWECEATSPEKWLQKVESNRKPAPPP